MTKIVPNPSFLVSVGRAPMTERSRRRVLELWDIATEKRTIVCSNKEEVLGTISVLLDEQEKEKPDQTRPI